MSSFKDYLSKSLQKEKEDLKQKTDKIKKTVFESDLNGYINKYKNLNEEDSEVKNEYLDNQADEGESEKKDSKEKESSEDNADDYEKDEDDESEKSSCPISTQDGTVNMENRQKGIDDFAYGPEKIDEANDEFWQEKKSKFMVKTIELAKERICGNCAAFSLKTNISQCLDNGIDKEIDAEDVWDADKENRGYCEFLDFKCHGKRTCNSWLEGGPIKD